MNKLTLAILLICNFYVVNLQGTTNMNEKHSIGIFLLPHLPDNAAISTFMHNISLDLTTQEISFAKDANIPHITLFQLLVDKKGLENIKIATSMMSKMFKIVKLKLGKTAYVHPINHIFWDVSLNKSLQKMYDYVFNNKFYQYRTEGLIKPIENAKHLLQEEHHKLIEKYGICFSTPETGFNPHFTLAYNIAKNAHIKASTIIARHKPRIREIVFDRIGIGIIGNYGNVESILATYDLQR